MAIVEMSKLSVIGLNDNKYDVLRELMTLGVCEISSQDEKLSDLSLIHILLILAQLHLIQNSKLRFTY